MKNQKIIYYFVCVIHPSIAGKLPDLIKLLKSHRVKSAYAFGSVCTDKFNETSDVDLLIGFEEGIDPIEYGDLYWSLDEKIPLLFNRSVDLMTLKQLKNPYFIKVMNLSKTPIYEG